jgi:hypothetical protein
MLTITLPFSGKEFCLTRVLTSLSQLRIPDHPVKLVFLDNSGHAHFNSFLASWLKSFPTELTPELLTYPPGYFSDVASIYNTFLPHIQGNWLALEDDVIDYPPDTLSRMSGVAWSPRLESIFLFRCPWAQTM